MSHFAQVINNVVQQVIVAEQDFINTLPNHTEWIQTSYNTIGNTHKQGGTPLRGNYAGIGYTYDVTHDVFYPPQPFLSWTLNQATWTWEAPVAMPQDEKYYRWNEETKTWVEVTNGN